MEGLFPIFPSSIAGAGEAGWGRRGRRVGGPGVGRGRQVLRCYRGLLLLLLHLFNNAFRRVQSIHLPRSGVIGRVRIEGGLVVEGGALHATPRAGRGCGCGFGWKSNDVVRCRGYIGLVQATVAQQTKDVKIPSC